MKSLINHLSKAPLWGVCVLLTSLFSDTPHTIIVFSLVIHILYLFKLIPKDEKIIKYGIVCIVVLSIYLVFTFYRTIFDLEAGISLLTLLLSAKLFEIKQIRDKAFYYYIGFIVVSGVAVFNQSFIPSILCLTLLSLGVWGHTSIHGEKQYTIKLEGISNKNVYLYSFVASSILIICYLLFPRLNFGFNNNSRLLGKSHFAPENRPGEVAELILSGEPVFVASLNKRKPRVSELYWVGTLLTRTDGYHWEQDRRIETRTTTRARGKRFPYEIQLRGQNNEYLFTPDSSLGPPNVMEANRTINEKSFKLRRATHKKVTYSGQYSPLPTIIKPQEKLYRNRKTYPKASRKVQELANTLKGATHSQTADNILNYFVNEGFVYTLKPGRSSKLDDFLFDSKKGFCTHFASAMGMLLRMNNIKARVVSGFQGGEYNEFGDFFTITQKDAHAWVEYFDNQQGWIRVDPVTVIRPERIRLGGQEFFSLIETGESFNRRDQSWIQDTYKIATLYFASINNKWQRFFYEYDQVKQFHMAKRLGLDLSDLYYAGGILIALLMGLIIFIQTRHQRIRYHDPVDREFEKLVKLAKRKKIFRSNFETANLFLEKIEQITDNKINYQEVSNLYYAYKFGGQKQTMPKLIATIKEIYQDLKKVKALPPL